MFEILIYYSHYYSFSGKKKFMKKSTKTRKKTSCRILLNGQTIHFQRQQSKRLCAWHAYFLSVSPTEPYAILSKYFLLFNSKHILYEIHLGEGVHTFRVNKFKEIMSEVHRLYQIQLEIKIIFFSQAHASDLLLLPHWVSKKNLMSNVNTDRLITKFKFGLERMTP